MSAAVAAAPTAPSLASVGSSPGKSSAPHSLSLVDRHTDPVLLHLGTSSPAVAQLQAALHITKDGIFGRQTEQAVRKYQKKHGLASTGKVDVKTWLTLFPYDTVIATPAGWSATTSSVPAVQNASDISSAAAPAAPQPTQPVSDVVHAAAAHAPAVHQSGGTTPIAATTPATPAPARQGTGVDPVPGGGGAPAGIGSSPVPSAPSLPTGGGNSGSGGSQPSVGGPTPQVTPQTGGNAADLINKMIAAANSITAHHYAYQWGGGHANFNGPYDCSGAVSAVLHAAGLLRAPMVSGDFVHWGAPGPGAVTIYANASHVYMSIRGHFFGTSGSNPGGGAAWYNGAPRAGFAVVHVPFQQMHLRPGIRAAAAPARLRVRRASHAPASSARTASNGGTAAPSSSAPTAKAASAQDQPTYDQTPPPPPKQSPPSSSESSPQSSASSGAPQQSTAPSGGAVGSGGVASPSASTVSEPSAAPAPAPAPVAPAPAPATQLHYQQSAPVEHTSSYSVSETPAAPAAATAGTHASGPGVSGEAPVQSHASADANGGSMGSGSASKSADGVGVSQSHTSISDGGSGSGSGKTALK